MPSSSRSRSEGRCTRAGSSGSSPETRSTLVAGPRPRSGRTVRARAGSPPVPRRSRRPRAGRARSPSSRARPVSPLLRAAGPRAVGPWPLGAPGIGLPIVLAFSVRKPWPAPACSRAPPLRAGARSPSAAGHGAGGVDGQRRPAASLGAAPAPAVSRSRITSHRPEDGGTSGPAVGASGCSSGGAGCRPAAAAPAPVTPSGHLRRRCEPVDRTPSVGAGGRMGRMSGPETTAAGAARRTRSGCSTSPS